jgi:hypothetical protein
MFDLGFSWRAKDAVVPLGVTAFFFLPQNNGMRW